MISKKIQDAFNEQINEELGSAYLYLSMSAYFESLNLTGFAHWMREQAKEEIGHAMRFYTHITDRNGRVLLSALKAPKTDWKSPLSAFQDALKHEEHISACIDKLVDLAQKEKDHPAFEFLQWFVDEQVEEEKSVGEMVEKLKLAGDHPAGLLFLDAEAKKREGD